MKNILNILTPENVNLEFELAGAGTRFIAFAIDFFIQILICALLVVAAIILKVDLINFESNISLNDTAVKVVLIILLFIIMYGYFIIFEMFMDGQTPGKKVLKIKVMKDTGESVNFIESVLRNIIRITDFLPVFYIIGIFSIVFSKRYKRIGDIAAGTVVVKIKSAEKSGNFSVINSKNEFEDRPLNIYPVNNFELEVIEEFLSRNNDLGRRKSVFEYHILNYFLKKFSLKENPKGDVYSFLNEIVRLNSI